MFTFLGHRSASLMNLNPPVALSTYIMAPVDLRAVVQQ